MPLPVPLSCWGPVLGTHLPPLSHFPLGLLRTPFLSKSAREVFFSPDAPKDDDIWLKVEFEAEHNFLALFLHIFYWFHFFM
jgi:hypothetical protein